MSNFFDQFDEPAGFPASEKNNFFDQFDSPSPQDRFAQADAYNASLNEKMGISNNEPAVQESTERGFLENQARGLGSAITRVGGELVEGVAALDAVMPRGVVPGVPSYAAPMVNEQRAFERDMSDEEFIKHKAAGYQAATGIADKIKSADLGYDRERNSFDKTKELFSKGNWLAGSMTIPGMLGDQITQSVPYWLSAPLTGVAAGGNTVRERVKNTEGKIAPDKEDVAIGSVVGAASGVLERILPKMLFRPGQKNLSPTEAREIGENATKYAMGKIGAEAAKDASVEALTEAIQSGVLEYVGQRYGTDKAMSLEDAAMQGLEGALVGGGVGASLGVARGGYDAAKVISSNAPTGGSDLDLPQNGEQIDGLIVYDLPSEKMEPLQLGHNPQRMIVMPDGTTAWESDAELLPPIAGTQHPAFAKVNETPDQIESTLGQTDFDAELESLLTELELLESIAREPVDMAPDGVNIFDRFDKGAAPEGLFDGIVSAQAQKRAAGLAAQLEYEERASAVINSEDDQRGFMGQVARISDQTKFLPEEPDPSNLEQLSEVYPPDPSTKFPQSKAEQRENVIVSEGLSDIRITRPEYRNRLKNMAQELVRGGGIGFIRDSNDRITGRTPSINPDWFKALNENPETSMSVPDVQASLLKALAGERLGVRQARVVGAALDSIGDERGSYARDIRVMRENARADRKIAFEAWLAATDNQIDSEFETQVWPESPGEIYNEDSYLPEASMEDRSVAELVQSADDYGVDWTAIDSALAEGDIKSQSKALTQLIWNATNEHRKAPTKEQSGARAPRGPSEGESASGVLEAKSTYQTQQPSEIDLAAATAATSPDNDLREPTAAQKEAGNYKKAHVKIQGLEIAIENPRGSVRSGTDKDGNSWSVTMRNHYGYIKRTEGADGDHVDVFIGPNPESDQVFIVDQMDSNGSFDEHKVLLGFQSKLKARSGYKSNYSGGWKVGPISAMSMADFKAWLQDGNAKRPISSDGVNSGAPLYSGNERKAGTLQHGERINRSFQEPSTDIGRASQLDLFLHPSANKRKAYSDIFGTFVKARPVTKVRSSTDSIHSIEDVAHVLASIRKDPQESFYTIVTDKSGKILRVMNYTRGTTDGASVYPIDVIAEAASIEGAAYLHLSHNHPSGLAKASSADTKITRKIFEMLDGTGIKPGHHAIVAGSSWGDGSELDGDRGDIRPRPRKYSIPITQRRFAKKGRLGDPITGPDDAVRMVSNHDNALFLLDHHNAPVAIIQLSESEMKELRRDRQINRILSALNSSNSRAVIIKTSDRDAAINLSKFLNSFGDIRVLDWIHDRGSDASRAGGVIETNGQFYSLGDSKNSGGIPVAKAKSIIGRISEGWNNPHLNITVVEDIEGLPDAVKEQIKEDKIVNEKVKGIFHNGSIFINASAIQDDIDVERAIFHEVHGHYGLRALFGRDTSTAMGRLYLAIGGEKGIREIATKHNIDLSKYEELLKGEAPGKRAEIVVDELLAHIAQDSKPSVKRWLQELLGAIRTWLRAHGFPGLSKFSDTEIMALLKRTREAATELKLDGGSVSRFLVDGKHKIATDKNKISQPAYSLSGLPPKTRKVIGNDQLLSAWTLLALDDSAFQLPVSEKKSLEQIFYEVIPDVKLERATDFDDNGARVWKLEPDDSTLALIFEKGDEVWIDVADFKQGQGGRRIYNAVANYAYNNGKKFIGDPAGLSDKAIARRLENMVSSALKFGTTKHIRPHEKQLKGGAGVPAIAWKDGDDAHNLREMIKASYEATKNQFPEIEQLRYDPENDQYIHQDSNNVFTKRDFEKLADSKRPGPNSGGPHSRTESSAGGQVTAGGRTLERAVLTHSILRGTREEQSRILARLSGERSKRLAGTLYGLGPNTTPKTRLNGGFSVSGAIEKLGYGKDTRGANLPPNVRNAYDMLGGKNKTFAEKVKQQVKRQLSPGGLLPREIFDLKIVRDSEMNSEDNQQRYILEDFYAQIVNVYHKPYHQLKAATRKEIDDFLKGDRTKVKLTPSMIEVLGQMRGHIQNLSSRYIDELLLDVANLEVRGKKVEAEEKRRLIATITENFDSYLHRSYRAFDDPDWPKKVPPDVYQTAISYLAKQYAGDEELNDSHAHLATKKIDLMLHEGTAYDSMARFIAESKLGSKDLSVLKKRKEIAPEIRALLGEYEDPAINYAKSVSKMTRLVSNTGFLRQMRDLSLELGYLYEEKDRPVGAHKKIAAESSEVYSPLNGLYTFPEFELALRDSVGSNKEPDWYKWIVTVNAAVKYGKTVLAPTTAMRNILSASMFSLTSGHWNLAHLDKSIKAVKTYFTGKDVRGSRDYISKLLKLGVLYDSPNYRELQELIKQVNESESITAKAMRKSKAASVLNYAQEFYALGDDFWKILGFENEKAQLIKHHGMTEADAEKEAAERIRNTYPTYSMTGRGIQTLRRFPLIGSFPSFPAEIIRTTYHKFRYFHQDAKSLGYSNPAVISKGIGLALGAGMMGAISALSAAMFGVDDDEEESIRQMLPEWSRNSNLLFLGRDDKGQVEYMDLTWLDPYSYWKKPLSALARDREVDEKAGDAAWEALSPFLGLDIAFGAAIQLAKDFANPGVTTEKATEKFGKSLAPGVITNALGFWNAAEETVTNSGKKYSIEDEALALLGFRKGTLNAKVGLTYQAYGYQDKKRAASTVLRDKATNLGKVEIEDLREAYEQSMEMHKDAWNEMRRMVRMALKTGMTKSEAVAALRTSGISLRDARLIADDQDFRYQPPKNMMKLAIKRAAILFDQETQQELKVRAKTLRALQTEYEEKPAR